MIWSSVVACPATVENCSDISAFGPNIGLIAVLVVAALAVGVAVALIGRRRG